MNTSLPAFVFNTLLSRMNDPSNATLFLPRLLAGMTSGGRKVLPLTASEWALGAIGGEGGAALALGFAAGWYNSVLRGPDAEGHYGIPCPDSPYPELALSGVTISALENMTLKPSPAVTPTADGYRLELELVQGRYAGLQGVTEGPVSIDCTYHITQRVCTASNAEHASGGCDGYAGPEPVPGSGTLRGTLSAGASGVAGATDISVSIAADLTVGADGGLELTVAGVQASVPLDGASPPMPHASFHVDRMTVDSTADRTLAQDEVSLAGGVLNTPQALSGILENLNGAMGTPRYLDALRDQLHTALLGALDAVLGTASATALAAVPVAPGTNPVDAYLLRRIHASLATPGTDYYLPGVILFFQDPPLEPYRAGTFDLGDQGGQGITFHHVTLTDLTIAGASNAVLASDGLSLDAQSAEGSTVTVAALLSTLPGTTLTSPLGGVAQTRTVPGPPLTITAGFSLAPGASPRPLTGTVAIRVRAARIQAVFTVSGTDLSTFSIAFNALTVSADPAGVEIDVDLRESSRPLEEMIATVLRSPACVNQVIAALNERIAAQLPDLGRTATNNVRTLAAASLDG